MLTFLASIFIFGLLIFAHEFGHFIIAKKMGITVLEFAIGFGPKLLSVERNGTQYSFRIFPLGGFCRMLGEDTKEIDDEGSFQNKPVSSRFAVIVAGPLMNFFLAVVLFFLIYFAFLGIPQLNSTRIGEIIPGEKAETVGLQEGDEIVAINENPISNWNEVVLSINSYPDKEISLTITRNGEKKNIDVIPREDPNTGRGLIGIAPTVEKYNLLQSIGLGFTYTSWFIQFIFVSFFQMITGQIPPDIAGPVGIIQVVGEVAETGFSNLLSLAAVISINLGIINLLPIPALDGSRLVFLGIETIRGRPLDPQKEGFIHFIGFTILILLMIIIAYNDVIRLYL